MAKTKTPFFSFGAQGSVGESITAQRRASATLLREKPLPTDPYSLAQAYQRWRYQDYAYLWTLQTQATRAEYRTAGSRYHLTAFQYWMRVMLTTRPTIMGSWRLDNALGALARDSSINALNCTIIGASSISGAIDHAFHFDGINDVIHRPDNPLHDFGTGDGSIEYYARPLSTANKYHLSKYLNLNGWLIENLDARPSFYLYYGIGVPLIIRPAVVTTPGVWQHHLITLDRSGNALYYLDGVPGAPTALAPAIAFNLSAGNFNIGAWVVGASYKHCDIDWVTLYDRLLDPTEALRHSQRRYPA